METTTDLANSIGLGTRQDAAFKGMPLTNFANKEYQINANNAKLEAERKRKEAELEKQLMSTINITGKFDKIAAPQIQKAYANMVMNKGYSNPEARYQFDVMKQNHELASAARKEQSDLLNKSDLLIDPKVKAALISHDTPQLELLSKDPNSGVVKDEQLPNTYTLAPEARIPRVPNITMEVKKYIPTDEASLDRSQTKLIKTVGGKNIYGTPIKESVLDQAATEVLSNPMLAKNWLAVHQDEIGKEVSKGVPLQQALINSFKDKNRFIETDTYTPSKSRDNESVWVNNNGQIESKSGWTATENGENGFLLNTKSPSGVGLQQIRVKSTKLKPKYYTDPTDKNKVTSEQIMVNGKPVYEENKEEDLMLRPTAIKYLGDDKWELQAKDKSDSDKTYEATTQSLKSLIGDKMIDELKTASGNKKYTSKVIPAKDYVAKKATPKTEAKPTALTPIKNPLITKAPR